MVFKTSKMPGSQKSYTIKITTSNDTVELKEIVFGDLWLCSGQSNMEFTMLNLVKKYPTEIAGSYNSFIREFQVARYYSAFPKKDLSGRWKQANPKKYITIQCCGIFHG